jgi:hypothetical protein
VSTGGARAALLFLEAAMLIGIMIAVPLVAVAAVLGYAAIKPDTFRLWRSWSPWERMDPALKRTYGGAPSGQGAVYEWEGNNKVGKGRMEIVEASAPSRIAIRLDFFKPFKASNRVEFTLEPDGDATRVTWAMHGPVP